MYTSFILTGFCIIELHAHLCPYRNVWPEATLFIEIYSTVVTDIYMYAKFRFSTLPGYRDTLVKTKKKKNNNKMKNCENELCYQILVIFGGPPYFDNRYIPFREEGFQIESLMPRKRGFCNVWE